MSNKPLTLCRVNPSALPVRPPDPRSRRQGVWNDTRHASQNEGLAPYRQAAGETESRTTAENFQLTRKLLDERGMTVETATVISRPYQQRRAYGIAKLDRSRWTPTSPTSAIPNVSP